MCDMRSMRVQIGTWLVKLVIELQVEVMRLEIHYEEHGRHCAGELPKGFKHILRLKRNTLPKLLIVDLRG